MKIHIFIFTVTHNHLQIFSSSYNSTVADAASARVSTWIPATSDVIFPLRYLTSLQKERSRLAHLMKCLIYVRNTGIHCLLEVFLGLLRNLKEETDI